ARASSAAAGSGAADDVGALTGGSAAGAPSATGEASAVPSSTSAGIARRAVPVLVGAGPVGVAAVRTSVVGAPVARALVVLTQPALLVLAGRVVHALAGQQLLELRVEVDGDGDVGELLRALRRGGGIGPRRLRRAREHLRGGQQVGVVPLRLAAGLALGGQHGLPPGQ